MVKLLIISDDFTGALDTGIQFAEYGAKTKIRISSEVDDIIFGNEDSEVLTVNLETRHLSKEKAYEIVYKIVSKAVTAGIRYIYKKTDSGLRGNVGSELLAVLHASGAKFLPFIPALPNMNRITHQGVHYVDGMPISDTVFGKDPYEPVLSSRVKELFPDSDTNVMEIWKMEQYHTEFEDDTIGIFDAETKEDIIRIANHLNRSNQLYIMAGCAGFASALPEILSLSKGDIKIPRLSNSLLIACGSINPITKKQIEYGEKLGYKRISMEPQQILEEGYLDRYEGKKWILSFDEIFDSHKVVMIDTGISQPEIMSSYGEKIGLNSNESRVRISKGLGRTIRKLIGKDWSRVIMVIGGDTLMDFFRETKCSEIDLICELEPGTVLSLVKLEDQKICLITKSGGFGNESLFQVLANKIEMMS